MFLIANNKNPMMDIQEFGGGGFKEGVGQPSWPGSTSHISGVEKKPKNTKKALFLLLILVLREPIVDPTHCGRWHQSWSGTWCFSQHLEGEWRLGCPAQHHKQGVHSKRRESGDWVALFTSHRGSTHTVATTEFLRKYKAVPKEVQGSTLGGAIQYQRKYKLDS